MKTFRWTLACLLALPLAFQVFARDDVKEAKAKEDQAEMELRAAIGKDAYTFAMDFME